MMFWDASAIVPLLVREPGTGELARLAREDSVMVVWWGTSIECVSAVARLTRDGDMPPEDETTALSLLDALAASWAEILATSPVREIARRLLRVHPLRAADALQLAAALVWVDRSPTDASFVARDDRLASAARKEGFRVV